MSCWGTRKDQRKFGPTIALVVGFATSMGCGVAFEEQFESKSKPNHLAQKSKGPTTAHSEQTKSTDGKGQTNSSGTAGNSTSLPKDSAAKSNEASPGDSKGSPNPSWVLDPNESAVSLVILKATGEHEVAFKDFTASLMFKEDSPEKLSIVVKTTSLDTPVVAFREHLKSKMFLNVKKFPEAKFITTEIQAVGSRKTSYRVRGRLTLRGQNKDIQFLARVNKTPRSFLGTAHVKIDAKHFGFNYPDIANELVEEIFLSLKLKFSRALA